MFFFSRVLCKRGKLQLFLCTWIIVSLRLYLRIYLGLIYGRSLKLHINMLLQVYNHSTIKATGLSYRQQGVCIAEARVSE